MKTHNHINYIEIPAKDLTATKKFFGDVFGWKFVDYGPDYCSFSNEGVDGGFFKSDLTASTSTGSVLVVLYSAELETTQTSPSRRCGEFPPGPHRPAGA